MVAAAVANRGVVMQPFVVDRVVGPDGKTVTQTKRHALGRTMSERNAIDLAGAMEAVVQAGTGTAAQIPGDPRRGQDRHGGDGSPGAEPDGVHRVRPGGGAAGSRSP